MSVNDDTVTRRRMMQNTLGVGTAAAVGCLNLATPDLVFAKQPGEKCFSASDWGARMPRGPVTTLDYKPSYIVLHETGTTKANGVGQRDAFEFCRRLQRSDMDEKRRIDTGYHFIVSRGGVLCEGRHRSLETLEFGDRFVRGTHAGAAANRESIAIANEGTYRFAEPPVALYNRLIEICALLCATYSIEPAQIFGPRDFMAMANPGDAFHSMFPQMRKDVAAKVCLQHSRLT